MLLRTLSLPVMALGLCCALRGQAQEIPADTALHTGRLPNGFTYYIRRNTQPQQRAELYLVNKIGSILENDDQRGLAHFMEHMNFNGTTHFPKNELVNYLQKAGVRFGADLNAYTTGEHKKSVLPVTVQVSIALISPEGEEWSTSYEAPLAYKEGNPGAAIGIGQINQYADLTNPITIYPTRTYGLGLSVRVPTNVQTKVQLAGAAGEGEISLFSDIVPTPVGK